MSTLNFFVKIFGMAEDEQGNPAFAGLKLGMEGQNQVAKEELDRMRAEIIGEYPNPRDLMRELGFKKVFEKYVDEDMVYITEEEYDRDYADEDGDEAT